MYSSLPTSGGIVGGGSFFGVHLSGLRFMPCNRSRELETGVGDPVAVGPATVPFWYLGTPRRSNWLASEFGDCAGELGGFHQGIDKLGSFLTYLCFVCIIFDKDFGGLHKQINTLPCFLHFFLLPGI